MAGEKARVLVVDDNPSTLATYGRILSIEGYEVATASGGREGFALLRSRAFDVIVASAARQSSPSGTTTVSITATGPFLVRAGVKRH